MATLFEKEWHLMVEMHFLMRGAHIVSNKMQSLHFVLVEISLLQSKMSRFVWNFIASICRNGEQKRETEPEMFQTCVFNISIEIHSWSRRFRVVQFSLAKFSINSLGTIITTPAIFDGTDENERIASVVQVDQYHFRGAL